MSRGQALVEFAIVAPLFFVCFLAAVDAALWAVQNSAEVAAVENAARVAASAAPNPLSQHPPDAATIVAAVAGPLRQTLFGTSVVAWCAPHGGSCMGCPQSPQEVEARLGPRVVALCVQQDAATACAATAPPGCVDSPMVTVRLVGFVAALVPPGFGPGASGGELPADLTTTTHTLRFAP